jgi:hypothetical protein
VSFAQPNNVSEQLERDFGVLPTSLDAARFVVGSDLVWLAGASGWNGGDGGLSLALALGPSLVGRNGEAFLQSVVAPPSAQGTIYLVLAASAGATLSMHLPSLPQLSIDASVTGHVLFHGTGPRAQLQLGLGASWHFL